MRGSRSDNKSNKLINYRPLFELALGMMAGVLICIPIGDGLRFAAVAVLASASVLLFFLGKTRFAAAATAALFGLTLASVSLPNRFEDCTCKLTGIVDEVAEENGGTVLILRSASLGGARFNKRVQLDLSKAGEYEVGDEVMTVADIRKPDRRFGAYDEFRIKLANGVGCAAKAETAVIVSKHNLPAMEFIVSVRSAVVERIKLVFEDDSPVFAALIVGDRSELTDERYAPFRASGTAHLLAISGFHVGIIAGALLVALKRLKPTVRTGIIALTLLFYCALTAFTPGVVRASVMLTALCAASCFERRGDQLSSLSLAAILILVFNPFQIYSIGFQLSFSAVFGIAIYLRQFHDAMSKLKLSDKLASAVAVCLSASIGTLAFQIRCFGTLSPYTLISNLIAVPAFSAIVILGVIVTAIAFVFPAASNTLAYAPRAVLFSAEWLLGRVSEMPYAQITVRPIPAILCIIYPAILFALSEYVLRPFKKRVVYAAALTLIFTFALVLGIIIV